jgi:hypothetical protein
LEIREQFGVRVERLVPLELDGEALRLILYLEDGTNLRVTEQWQGQTLKRYSYYWLSSSNELKVGWAKSRSGLRHEGTMRHITLTWRTSLIISISGIKSTWLPRTRFVSKM